MPPKSAKILLTGPPGCGKTTAIMRILEELKDIKAAGFYTLEIRQNNVRKGFSWRCLDGSSGLLAHVDTKGPFRVGKYGVDVVGFEETVVPVLDTEKNDAELFIIDEIGKMECLSEKFIDAVRRLFDSDKSVLATVAQKGSELVSEVKNHPKAKLFRLSHDAFNKTIDEVLKILSFLRVTLQ